MRNLGDNEVHIWHASRATFRHLFDAESLLSPDEKSRHQAISAVEARDEFLIGRYLLRTGLSRYHPRILPADWNFKISPLGKLSIEASSSLPQFCISHSAGKVVCAFSRLGSIGIDVESTLREKTILGLAQRFFSDFEYAKIKDLDSKEQATMFFKFWTLKEAYSKATGFGLQTSFDKFYFNIDSEDDIKLSTDQDSRWKFRLVKSPGDFQIAIAVETESNFLIKEFQEQVDYSGL